MRDCFITDDFKLDLSRVQTFYMEKNPRFYDKFFRRISMPFKFHMTPKLRISMGFYDNLNVVGLKKRHKGIHYFEGRAYQGVLDINKVEGSVVSAQVISGFDELPSFGKTLKELFEDYLVGGGGDIYKHAEEVYKKSYPEVKYNFPRVIYEKDTSDNTWKLFNQFINDMDDKKRNFVNNNERGQDWYKKRKENKETLKDQDKYPKNRNIMHPMPYVLYVLERGFQAAGYTLKGDILNDEDFKQRVIFNPKVDYLKRSKPIRVALRGDEGIPLATEKDIYNYKIELKNLKSGRYIVMWYNLKMKLKHPAGLYFLVNGKTESSGRTISHDLSLNIHKLKIDIKGRSSNTLTVKFQAEVSPSNMVDDVILNMMVIRREHLYEESKKINLFDDTSVNEIDLIDNTSRDARKLSRFLPNMRFGRFVRTLKNWKNYDMEVKGKEVHMNLLHNIRSYGMKDISHFEIANPTKLFVSKRGYNIKFPDIKGYPYNNTCIFADDVTDNKFIRENGGSPKASTKTIEINGYCMPLRMYKGVRTADIQSDDENVLALINSDFTKDNLATNPKGLMLPEIVDEVWLQWVKHRMSNHEFQWTFFTDRHLWQDINIRDTLYVYKQKVWIKEVVKTVVDKDIYKVEMRVETVD